ncbi:alpha/beta fold hydrolase [Virgibacillus kekensis]|uniref:Alpha/beta fold hydrolase n=1 Tax=Virgibacillus kekensis TaxID=202261 RepID=A0ABV9DLM2_9BACI
MEQEIKLNKLKSESGLHVHIISDGEAIVFLHGGPGSEHRFFLPHVLPLSQKFKLIFYDQRGCGESYPTENNQYTMEGEVDTLEYLRKNLGIKKVNLFGESWGSILALLYATSYPERVNKIMLTAAIGITGEGFTIFAEELEKRLADEDKIKLLNLEEKYINGSSTIEEKIFEVLDKYYVYSEKALERKQKTTMNTIVNEAIGKDIIKNYDLTNKVDKIKNIPILIAQGSHDILTPDLIKSLLLEHIPHAKLTEVKECGHWTLVEKPSEIIEIARNFFEPPC